MEHKPSQSSFLFFIFSEAWSKILTKIKEIAYTNIKKMKKYWKLIKEAKVANESYELESESYENES